MPLPRKLDPASLTLQLQAQGPMTAQTLAAATGVDRSRVSRALTGLGAPIVRLGVTRGARYALRRRVRSLNDTFPIRRIDAQGRAHDWAELTALHGGWQVTWASATNPPTWSDRMLGLGGWSEGFPFFLGDVRPQGYLGRAVARRLPVALGLGTDPRDWGDDATLVFLASEGDDLPGDLIVGDVPLTRYQTQRLAPSVGLAEDARAEHYPALIRETQAEGPVGSSVEGEQPKFLVRLNRSAGDAQPIIVKFTDTLASPTGRRWADLLVAEALALTILHAAGEAHATPRIYDAADRRFLEMERFDRVGEQGRRGVVSLRALHETFGAGDTNDWSVAADELRRQELISPETHRSIRLRQAFGDLIGNTDMHFGNLAFWLDDTLPFRLAPAYDVLPMLWAPAAGGELVPRTLNVRPPLPAHEADWLIAAGWAEEFWARVAADVRVSPEFAERARAAGALVVRMRAQFGAS
ncbi:MAG: type II toxin-antitoxin system HipA family toxin YjjJ [Opitutae bacterium]|nr:type II toxin-antitoxin system HipA family toxin YjjJ [Opitutae bacterium]